MKLNGFQKWMIKALRWIADRCDIPKLPDIEKANRWFWDTAMRIGFKRGQKENPICQCCTYYLNAQRNTALIEPPTVTTSGKIEVTEIIGAREKARRASFKHQLNSRPSGKMLAYHRQMGMQKIRLELFDEAPDTVRVPAVPKPAVTQDLRSLLKDEDADTFLL